MRQAIWPPIATDRSGIERRETQIEFCLDFGAIPCTCTIYTTFEGYGIGKDFY